MSPIDDNAVAISTTEVFDVWLKNLRDGLAAAQIAKRVERLRRGHWGDAKSVGDGVMEMRLHTGPGYRLYAVQRHRRWIVLLGGGDKSSQRRDIAQAKRIAAETKDEIEDHSI